MQPHTWFTTQESDQSLVAVIMDDLHVHLSTLGTITICGPADAVVTIDFDDSVDLAAVLAEAVSILRLRGCQGVPGAPATTDAT